MGLMIHSLGELPDSAGRGYYIYLLDYGWHEPLGEALMQNFNRMSDLASRHDAVVLRGTVGSHFEDEVLSYHHINGQPSEDILPAILITTRHPRQFDQAKFEKRKTPPKDKLILIPLRQTCKTSTDVAVLINKIFTDIRDKKALSDFEVAKEFKQGTKGAVADALILQPNFGGLGIDLKTLFSFLRDRKTLK